MEVRYDGSQDLTLILTDKENEMLSSGPTEFFNDMHLDSEELVDGRPYILLRGVNRELGEYVFLGCSREALRGASDFGMGEIVIPDKGTWFVNLNSEGLKYYRDGWVMGVRYNALNRLFIRELRYYNER